jgi:hypothetical protein
MRKAHAPNKPVTPNFSPRIGSPSVADRIDNMVFMEASSFHPDCNCSANIYRHPFDDALPLEVSTRPCMANGTVHDRAVLETTVRNYWARINNSARDFVAAHEWHHDA